MKEITDAASHPKLYEIRLLICVAQADGYMDEEEKERIFQQVNLDTFTVRERQIFHDDLENPKDPKALALEVSPYLTTLEKMMLIRKMFKLASLDKEIVSEEIALIYSIGQALGLALDKIKEIEQWVREGIAWMARWENIVTNR
ncbi:MULTISPECIES: DUF533 domain-containing protein [Aneurinibacillus]|uniref:DUF533 domain-containing protein n=1 Tax=Aneurinibacillus TaxID=55079 RepID=UPI00070A4F9B|nr:MULTISPECIES: DUF533 domain-containing protein [Aneurinibacillus]AMA73710.1 hypothetical protein ACH33_13135 [Aneurinibacillus sp. XH2]MED0677393.1 DUF533 domain-containing protein [Aneurinibacillus thermoaerophilus]MED0679483.1 DUF533 domain-containing protein [Aneurinibacillus thermoaerophilus]MED0737946.1 DUF533 domain-containing protein [Aneurinibacillus thermoaerophilus]MED0765090.1 DUF533 domain-containing protein [Aneurinibacillus thermoaerophilus]